MPFSINSASPTIPNSASNTNTASFERLGSGSKINHAGDDAAGLAISQRITTKLGGFDAAIRNSGDGISAIQVADGVLNSLTKNIGRIQELATQSANGTLNDKDRQALQAEASQLMEESNRIIEQTNFNGKSLLSSASDLNIQLEDPASNINIKGKDLASEFESLGFNDIDLSSQAGASAALGILSDASESTILRASELGAISNRLENSIENLASSRVNSAEARSRITDTDFAKETADLAASQVQNQVQIAIQSQANSQRDFVLQLLS